MNYKSDDTHTVLLQLFPLSIEQQTTFRLFFFLYKTSILSRSALLVFPEDPYLVYQFIFGIIQRKETKTK